MTTGAIIFAQNNSSLDYVKLAVFSARRIREYLDIPVSIITDSVDWLNTGYPNHPFDQVIPIGYQDTTQYKKFNDGTVASKTLEWKNLTRNLVYDLTPYDRTLVIDSDYIINSSVLKPAFLNDYDFQIYHTSMDLAPWRSTAEFTRINQYSIPFYWATTFVFQKNTITQAFFDLVSYIKSNWLYFRNLYSIDDNKFRNDFAFSIAIHIMNGKTNGGFATELPGTMTFITDKDIMISLEKDKMKFLIEKENYLGEYTLAKTQGIDVHVMNKLSLSRFIDGGSGV
jgi:hypothetical protein